MATVVGVLFVSCSVFVVTPALAASSHSFSFAFGGTGTVAGEADSLSLTSSQAGSGVAVNNATHDVYVADTGNRRVAEFTDKGVFVRAWGWGVATGAAELQVCELSCRPGLSGAQPGEFETPAYIAVDNGKASASKGDVYVADVADDLVTKFDGEGKLVSSWGNNGENAVHERTEPNGQLNGITIPPPAEPFDSGFAGLPIVGIAIDGSGNLWIYNNHRRLFEFKEDGSSITACDAPLGAGPGEGGIVVNDGKLYFHDGFYRIQAVDPPPACTNPGRITAFVEAEGPEPRQGVAIDLADGDFYVVREGVLVEDIPGSCVPSPTGCPASQAFGGEGELSGATGDALDAGEGSDAGRIYVANGGNDEVVAFDIALEANIKPASNISAHEATLHGTVNPKGVELESCEFEVGTTTAYGRQIPCREKPGEIGNGTSPVPVEAVADDLRGGAAYHVRLHARSRHGAVFSEDEKIITLPTAVVIGEQMTSEVTASSVTFKAVVNPEGLAARYHFEYEVCEASGRCVGSPFTQQTPTVEIPAGSSNVPVSQTASGSFAVGATWHFRIFVEDANGAALPSPEGTFVLEPPAPGCAVSPPRLPVASSLADCRAYELVTPPAKNGALIDNGVFIEDPSVAPDGSRVLSLSLQCFHESQSCTAVRQTEGSPYSFARSASGWETESLMPSVAANSTILASDASTDRLLLARSADPLALEELYAREPDGTLRPIGPIGEAVGAQIGKITPLHRLATADLSHVIYEAPQLWPGLEGNTTGEQALSYPSGTGGQPMLVGVSGGTGSTSLIGACGMTLGGTKPIHSVYNSLSADGRTTFFTVQPCSTGTGTNTGVAVPAFTIYERVEGAGGMKTVLVSGPGPESVCDAECRKQHPRDASYEGASTDGSRVFFTDTEQLTNDASNDQQRSDSAYVHGCKDTSTLTPGCNLYEFVCPEHCEDMSRRALVDASSGDTSGLGPRVQGVMAIPPDGSDVFFVAKGVLTGGPNAMGAVPSPGSDNLYVYREGAGGAKGSVTFVAKLSEADDAEWAAVGVANVSENGNVLVFTSHHALTADSSHEEGPAQVYRYDVAAKRLSRVSIGQAGFNDNGNTCELELKKTPVECKSGEDAQIVSAFHGFESGIGPGRSDPTMSADGNLVFFESSAGLTPSALNYHSVIGNPKAVAENVYEWAADGTQPSPESPACAEPNGCVSLISDGHDLNEGSNAHNNRSAVQLLGTDSTGENVFFWTADPLLARDTDSQVDLYDARVGGGFPEPLEPEPCPDLEACHGKPSPPPAVFGPLATASFSGAGNAPGAAANVGRPVVVPSTRRLAPAEQLAVALKACASKRGRVRTACEQRAREVYRVQLLASGLRDCRGKHGRARVACEHRVRKLYAKTARGFHR